MVTVKLDGTYYYGPRGNKRRYGPGDAVLVPEGLATALGLTPIYVPLLDPEQETAAANVVAEQLASDAPRPAMPVTPTVARPAARRKR